MKVCVIGAGGSGLIAIKHSLDFGCEVIAFEQGDNVGGLWNFTEETELDKNGIEVHSSMYENLTTNLPIEIMCYPHHPFRAQKKSYVPSEEILRYYENFADNLQLRKHIMFEHQVIRVHPLSEDGSWEVMVKDVKSNEFTRYCFDAVLVCIGHFHSGHIPTFKGQELFKGKQMHSSKHRRAENYKGEKVLVIGGAYSGFDIVQDASKFADRVVWSHHLSETPDAKFFTANVSQKPDIECIYEDSVEFVDGTSEEFTMIVYCTGYDYKFPFLSIDCGISTNDGYVKPLWMHCVNINHPTMAIIGVNHLICPNQTFDIQVRFFLTFMTGKKSMPSRFEMIDDLEMDIKWRKEKNYPSKKFHHMGGDIMNDYFRNLADRAEIEPIQPIIAQMHVQSLVNRKNDYIGFHDYKFEVVDENNFKFWKLKDL